MTRNEQVFEEFERAKKEFINPFLNFTAKQKMDLIKNYGFTQELIAHIRKTYLEANPYLRG